MFSQAFAAEFLRALRAVAGRPGEVLQPLMFLLVVTALVPLGIGPEPGQLARFSHGFIWIAALLATLQSLDALFRRDLEDGVLAQLLLLSPAPWLGCLARLVVHWLGSGLPIVLLAPLLGLWLRLPAEALGPLLLTLLLGTPVLTLIGGIGAALTAGLQRGGVLLALVIAPLYVPVLVLGVGAVELAASGLPASGAYLWLAALLVLAATLAPLAVEAALRINVEGG